VIFIAFPSDDFLRRLNLLKSLIKLEPMVYNINSTALLLKYLGNLRLLLLTLLRIRASIPNKQNLRVLRRCYSTLTILNPNVLARLYPYNLIRT